MSTPALATALSELEDELFYAVLDVALDIDQALIVQSGEGPIRIEAKREAIRFLILYPENSVQGSYRYADLRKKGLMLLKKQGAVGAMDLRKWGMAGWQASWEIVVTNKPWFATLLAALKSEHQRRNPAQVAVTDMPGAADRVLQLAESFHRVAMAMRDRRTGRERLIINDEYDVQYLLAALLESRFDDVRPEEWTPSYAGGASRVDFFLKNESVFVETKMMRDGLTDRKLGDELIIDIEHYKQTPNCKALLCFVYDPKHRLKNPRALENDLTKRHDELPVWVIVRPK